MMYYAKIFKCVVSFTFLSDHVQLLAIFFSKLLKMLTWKSSWTNTISLNSGYYRRFVHDYAKLAKFLTSLLRGRKDVRSKVNPQKLK